MKVNKLLLTFLFIYLCLFSVDLVSYYLPWLSHLFDLIIWVKQKLAIFFYSFFVEDPHSLNFAENSSRDRLFDNLLVVIHSLIAVLLSWLLFILKKKVPKIFLINICVFCLSLTFITYGAAKFFGLQFAFIRWDRLVTRLGDMTPMRLLWTFMSSSSYLVWSVGSLQVVAGIGLLFKNTRLLSLLVLLPITVIILMFNLFFDGPLKLYSLHFLLMIILLLYVDSNLIKAILSNLRSYNLPKKRKEIFFISLKVSFVLYLVLFEGISMGYTEISHPDVYGSKTRESETEYLAILSDKKIGILKNGRLTVKEIDMSSSLRFEADREYLFFKNQRYKKINLTSFPLLSTKFKWISEFPNNR